MQVKYLWPHERAQSTRLSLPESSIAPSNVSSPHTVWWCLTLVTQKYHWYVKPGGLHTTFPNVPAPALGVIFSPEASVDKPWLCLRIRVTFAGCGLNRETKKGKAPEPSCTGRLTGLSQKWGNRLSFLKLISLQPQQTAQTLCCLGKLSCTKAFVVAINGQRLEHCGAEGTDCTCQWTAWLVSVCQWAGTTALSRRSSSFTLLGKWPSTVYSLRISTGTAGTEWRRRESWGYDARGIATPFLEHISSFSS